jgi:hypothetical protein
MKRDGFKCCYRGLDGQANFDNWLQLSWDHLLPKGHPDRDDPEFIVCACNFCNCADNRYFDLAESRSLGFQGLSRDALVEQRRPYVQATRSSYREFWTSRVKTELGATHQSTDLPSRQKLFLQNVAKVTTTEQAVSSAIVAALQHNPTYLSPSYDGRKFRETLAASIHSLSDQYSVEVSETEHEKAIIDISDAISAEFGQHLRGGRLRIGTVQKALNLYLKTAWCLDPTRANPPHCPVDGIILAQARVKGKWTELDSIVLYKDWIEKLRVKASQDGFSNLAEWELASWKP